MILVARYFCINVSCRIVLQSWLELTRLGIDSNDLGQFSQGMWYSVIFKICCTCLYSYHSTQPSPLHTGLWTSTIKCKVLLSLKHCSLSKLDNCNHTIYAATSLVPSRKMG